MTRVQPWKNVKRKLVFKIEVEIGDDGEYELFGRNTFLCDNHELDAGHVCNDERACFLSDLEMMIDAYALGKDENLTPAATELKKSILDCVVITDVIPGGGLTSNAEKESVEEPDCEHYMQDLFCPKRPEGTHGPNVCRPQAPWSCWRTKKEGKCLKTQANARATAPMGQDNMRPVSGVMADTFKGIDKGIKKMFPTKEG